MLQRERVCRHLEARSLVWISLLLLAATAAACGEEEPVRQLDVEPSVVLPESAPVGQPLDVVYRWVPGPDFSPPSDDYRVYVHLIGPDGEILLQDDHYPPLPTSQWRAGEEVTYKRWIYPPTDLRPDYIDFYVGLYDDDGRIAVKSNGEWEGRPVVHRLYIRADDVAGLPVTFEGWYDEEMGATSHERWSWMGRRAVAAFGNPRGPAILHLRAHSPVVEIGGPQIIRISIGDVEIATIEVTDQRSFQERIEIPAEALGDGDWVEITIEVDKWFTPAEIDPASSDTRELGLQVFGLYLAPATSS